MIESIGGLIKVKSEQNTMESKRFLLKVIVLSFYRFTLASSPL